MLHISVLLCSCWLVTSCRVILQYQQLLHCQFQTYCNASYYYYVCTLSEPKINPYYFFVITFFRQESWLVQIGAVVSRVNTMVALRIGLIITCLVFSLFVWFGGTLTPRLVFSTLSHITFLRYTLIQAVEGIGFILESHVGYKRIKV